MYFVGIDVAKRFHVASIINEVGAQIAEPLTFKNNNNGFIQLLNKLISLNANSENILIGMEATGHYWICLFDYLKKNNFDVVIINPIQTDAFRKVSSIRKTKTDEIDSNLIAQLLRFEDYSPTEIASEEIQSLKQLSRYRKVLVEEITAIKNKATAILDRIFPEYENIFSQKYGETSRALLKNCATPDEILQKDIRSITKILTKASKGKCGRAKAEEIKLKAKESIAIKYAADSFSFEIKLLMQKLEFSLSQLNEIDEKLHMQLNKTSGKYLLSIPGVGIVLASTIASEIGDANRFDTPKQLVAFAGMDASKYQSGETESTGHMSKRGSHYLRWALMTAAESARKFDPYLKEAYDRKINEGKHYYVALSVVARKLCGITLTLMKEQRNYEPTPPK